MNQAQDEVVTFLREDFEDFKRCTKLYRTQVIGDIASIKTALFAKDAIFISLDYKGTLNHPKIKEYQWATQASDYDVTAGLITSLDAVVGVNTTAIHCANALGIPTHILVPTKKQWRYEPAEDGSYVWSKTAKIYQQADGENWREVIKRVTL